MSEKHPWTFVTAAFAVNAAGNAIPPSLIFPRVKFHQHFLRDGPTGCDGDANPSGWMMEQNFVKFTKHFVSYAPERRPSLLLLDNHDSHLSAEALDYFKANAVTLLSFPPHCSHKLQPLDRSVYGPLKKQINTACDAWVCTNKRPMTIYDIPSILARAAPLALTPVNIMAGFKVSGIFPLNPEIFTDSDFMPSYFTDRPAPAVPNLESTNNPEQTSNLPEQSTVHSLNSNPPKASNPSTPTQASTSEEAVPSSSTQTFPIAYQEGVPSTSKQTCPTPEEVRPFEKAAPRKQTRRGKKIRKSAILTDTPVKNQLKMEKDLSKKGNCKRNQIKGARKNKIQSRPGSCLDLRLQM